MRVAFLVVALVLISASVVAFLWIGAPPAAEPVHRSYVSGRVHGKTAGSPWAGTTATLGPEVAILAADGEFKFSMLPGHYRLTICCSVGFQAVEKEVVVEKSDVTVDVEVNPLREIKGSLAIQGGVQVPYGFLISASRAGSNVVAHAETAVDGSFTLHLMEGDWEIHMDNLPPEYKVVSMTLGADKVLNNKFTLAEGAESLPLQIALK